MRLAVILLLTSSCASLLPKPDPPALATRERCESISASFGAWGVVAAVGGGTALISGVTNAILSDDTSEIALGLTSLAGGLVASISGFVSANAARQYVDECTVNSGGAR
jgi:hypothetical protein